MRIVCDQCSQPLDLPDDKIPQQRFSITCPTCHHKIVVDPPTAPPAAAPTPTPAPAAPEPAAAPPANVEPPAPAEPQDPPGPLPPLRGVDRELVESIPQSAIIVHHEIESDARLEQALRQLDMREIHHLPSVSEACEFVQENEVALLVVRLNKVPAPPCPPLEPVYKLPFDLRRKTFVAVIAENVKTLDGQVAFYLQVNCLIQAAEPSIAGKLRRALVHHLRLYRHWHTED
ncbi:MAG: zinc-ribbon domain-containing protein [Acidobacteriota bacterium]